MLKKKSRLHTKTVYFTENTMCFDYKEKLVNAVREKNRCFKVT
jgi:hypothetical protein